MDVETPLRQKFKRCAYCRCELKAHPCAKGTPGDKATIEHLNRHPPFDWPELKEEELVIVCGSCNSSRGDKRLADWFRSPYCEERDINEQTVAAEVKRYLATAAAKR